MATGTNNYSRGDEKINGRLTLDISTQTDCSIGFIAKNCKNYDPELSSTREVKEKKLKKEIENSDGEGSVDLDQKCPICLGALTDSGSHRLCALRCGHMFGYECINRWLNLDNKWSGRCPQCKAKASTRHIRFLYTNKLSSKGYFNRMKEQLKQACYKRLKIKRALIKQKQKTRKYKKMYKATISAVGRDFKFQNQI